MADSERMFEVLVPATIYCTVMATSDEEALKLARQAFTESRDNDQEWQFQLGEIVYGNELEECCGNMVAIVALDDDQAGIAQARIMGGETYQS